jgi:uncharacterized membrane protein YphA (DoxX/SURF4 family)
MEGERPAPTGVSASETTGRFLSRVSLVYLALFCLATQLAGSLFLIPSTRFDFRGFGTLPPMREITQWVAETIFGIRRPLDYVTEGETTFFWIQTLWLVTLALALTAVWVVLDRRRDDSAVHGWFRLFFRLALASQMFEYGMTKVVPNQFVFPSLTTLMTPVGDLSLSTLLWTSVGASPVYQVLTGAVELAGGVLLLFPRTTLPGAILSLGALAQIFALNISYDIPLKLTTIHLILLAVYLIAPDARRLAGFLLANRTVDAQKDLQPFRTAQSKAWAQALQLLWGAYLLGTLAYINWGFWQAEGGGRPRSPLYGIWNVQLLSVDGRIRPPVLNDYDRQWRRVIFDVPEVVTFQRTDDSFARYGAAIDPARRTILLTKGNSRTWQSLFTFEQPEENTLVLSGTMDGLTIQLELERLEFDTLRLLNSPFRWIYPDAQ